MISTEAWRAAIGSFHTKKCGMLFIMYGSNNLNRSHVHVIVHLLLPFAVFRIVMLLSSMNLKPKYARPDCSFSIILVFKEMMFSACCYYVRDFLLSGDVELNPGPCKYCPACNASIHISVLRLWVFI